MKRTERFTDATTIAPTARDAGAMLSLAWAGILSTSQLRALHYPSTRVAQRRLRALFDAGLVRVHVPSQRLSDESTYTLSPEGVALLEARGLVEEGSVDPARTPRLQKLRHTLLCREPFVILRRAEASGSLRLLDYQFDHDLSRVADLTKDGVILDGLAVVERAGRTVALAIECDGGTETTTVLRQKCERLMSFMPLVPTLVGATSAQLLFIALTERRRATIERLVVEIALADTRVIVLADLASLVARGYPFGVFVRAVRAERIPDDARTLGKATDPAPPRTAFRRAGG
ncbi:MAG: replication-relaxation family protein [Polyangiales bacterium]